MSVNEIMQFLSIYNSKSGNAAMLNISGDAEEFDCGTSGTLGLGTIEWMCDKDKHDNKVSRIMLPDGTRYRMVHHNNDWWYRYATVYGGYNKFMRLPYRGSERDTVMNTIQLGGYKMGWGDGEPGAYENHPEGPNLSAIFDQIHEGEYSCTLFILNVLLHAGNIDACWYSK